MADGLDRQKVDLAEEARDEAARGPLVKLARRRDLQQAPVIEDRDARRQRQGLALIVRDEDEGGAEVLVQPLHLVLHPDPEMLVERREGLVEQQHRRFEDERPCQRDPLLLSPGQLSRPFVLVPGEPDPRHHGGDTAGDVLARHLTDLERKRDVLLDGLVREQRVALEHHAEGPAFGRPRRDVDALAHQPPRGGGARSRP